MRIDCNSVVTAVASEQLRRWKCLLVREFIMIERDGLFCRSLKYCIDVDRGIEILGTTVGMQGCRREMLETAFTAMAKPLPTTHWTPQSVYISSPLRELHRGYITNSIRLVDHTSNEIPAPMDMTQSGHASRRDAEGIPGISCSRNGIFCFFAGEASSGGL